MRDKKLTKAHLSRLSGLKEELEAAISEVYAASHPRMDIPFSGCLKMAPASSLERYEAATAALRDFATQMVREGRAYFDGGRVKHNGYDVIY